ncbi:MAG TPA: VIT and VWA domain-containing protein [Gammaproteobacteria bacterium]|nr:VIT and VWA domain-containing protein [Gammaproteobacteria bacterium]
MSTFYSPAPLISVAIAILAFGHTESAHATGLLRPVGDTTPLDIRDHTVRVLVEDGYVVTEVEQVFINRGPNEIEAVYSFPVPLHAAVAEFTYWIDGQPVTAEVVEKERAREIYESERAAGRETAIAEKDDYRTFDISVFPVAPNGDVRTRLVYLQTAHTDLGIGRYVYPLEEGGVDEERIAFWQIRDKVIAKMSFELELKSSYPIGAVRVPNQPAAQIEQRAPGHWRIAFESGPGGPADFDAQISALESSQPTTEPAGVSLNEDVVVYWRHQAGLPGLVDLVTHRPDASGRGTFMLTVTPGDDLPVIESGRDWVFVLDRSGSMEGKFATLAAGVESALGQLNPADSFAIIAFNDSTANLTSGFVTATPENVARQIDVLQRLPAKGGTDLHAGLSQGLRMLNSDRASAIVLVTDGVANVGVTDKRRFLDLINDHDVRLFTFIMGNSANVPLLESMTEVSNGFAMSVSNSDDIIGQLQLATTKLTHHAMHDVALEIDGVPVSDVQPERIGSVYRGEQLVLLGHYWRGGNAEVSLTAKVAGADVSYQTRFAFPETNEQNPELERLWAYRHIEHLQSRLDLFGTDEDIELAIRDLAIEYGLLTDWTSMIVVRDDIFEALGIERRNRERVTDERVAREQRRDQAPSSRRVDQNQPMFNQPRPSSGGGGGAIGLELIVLLGLAIPALRRARRQRFLQ